MVSLLYNAFKYVLNLSKEPEPDLADVIQRLEYAEEEDPSVDVRTSEELEATEGCFHRTGIITSMNPDYLIIDDKYTCKSANARVPDIEIGVKVSYVAFQRSKDEEMKITKISSVVDELWENCDSSVDNNVKNEILNRVVVGQVVRREQRNVFVEPGEISFSLDEVHSEFVPLVGDWVKVRCIVRVDDTVVDYSGDVLEVDQISPLRSKLTTGIVTYYDVKSGFGTVDNNVGFNKTNCEPGYIPRTGDKVITDCIESDQGKHTWRSLSVVPLTQQVICSDNESSMTRFQPVRVGREPDAAIIL